MHIESINDFLEYNIMIDLSIIVGVRNDNYGGNYVERVSTALTRNLENFKKADFSYEFIIVDWNSGVLFNTLERFCGFFADPHVRTFYVSAKAINADGLNPIIYYEYFAKNVGLRNASGKHVLITNSDIFISESGIEQIGIILKSDISGKYVRTPIRYRLDKDCITEMAPVKLATNLQATDASGDFVLCLTDDAINRGRGYNESDQRHRTKFQQTSMDSEFVINMYYHGMRPIIQDIRYYHIEHDRPRNFDYKLDTEFISEKMLYENTETWGMINYSKLYDKEKNLIIIS